MPVDRIDELRTVAAWTRQRRDLYRAKTYGSRPTSPERLRELEREAARADERLRAALAAHQRT
jgi:hypothetical protein